MRYDPTTTSPFFNFRNESDGEWPFAHHWRASLCRLLAGSTCLTSLAITGRVHQMWYEDPRSLGAKYEMAAKLGLRGVGFYCASGSWPDRLIGSDAEDTAMWASVRDHFVRA